jgi:integration host factor subunit alpha
VALGKKYIIRCISTKAVISSSTSEEILNTFLNLIKLNKDLYDIKISNFGTFYNHQTKNRIGRNPKTKKEYLIKSHKKTLFRASSYIKKYIN